MRRAQPPGSIRQATQAAQRKAALVRAMLAFLRVSFVESQSASGAMVHRRTAGALSVSRAYGRGGSTLTAELAGRGVVAAFRLDAAALTFQTRAIKLALVPEWSGLLALPGPPRAPAKIVPFPGGRHAA